MKSAVVFYSLEGNTRFAAEKIARNLGADLIELKTVTPFPKKGLAKFFHGGKSSVFGDKPALLPYEFDASRYDKVVIGCPIWAFNCAAPMNTFLADHGNALGKLGGENIGVLLCQSGTGAENAIAKYKDILKVSAFAAELILYDPVSKARNQAKDEADIQAFCEKMRG